MQTYQKQPNPKNQWQGRVNKAQGNFFEQMIDTSCEYYRLHGEAVIEKTPEPFHITKSIGNGKFQGNFAKAAQPDYKGALPGGHTIIFEAKHSADEQIKQDRVTKDQVLELDDYEKAGALCYVMVSIKMTGFFFVPWGIWKQMSGIYGRKYITLLELKPYSVPFDGQRIDFLRRVVR